MSSRNWDRPRFKTQGRKTESITGSDIPDELRGAVKRLPRPKAEQRREAEEALRQFMAKKPKPSHQLPLAKVSIVPPIDDDDLPF